MKSTLFTLLLLNFATMAFATNEKQQLQLRVTTPWGSYNQTTIYFDLGVSPQYIANQDAPKFFSDIDNVPNIYSLSSDNVKCDINGYSPLTQSAEIGIGLLLDTATDYTFTLSQFANFDSTTLVILEDRQLNVFTEMQVNFYTAHLTLADTTGRFFLHVTKAVQFTPVTAGCSNNNGSIAISADSTIVWNNVSVIDTGNMVVNVQSGVQGQFNFGNLAEGYYKIILEYNSYITSKTVYVNGTYIVASFTASEQNVVVGENITFNSTANNTTDYVWTFGDSTFETGVANPTYFYYTPGTYTVTLVCSNSAGCSAEVQMQINVSESTGIGAVVPKGISIVNLGAKTVEVMMNDVTISSAEVQVYNILGQAIYTSPITDKQMEVSLNNQPAGIYLVTVKNGSKSITSKIYIN